MSAPATVTADRLDRVTAGQYVHTAPFTLSDTTPTTGWQQVTSVDRDAASVLLSFADGAVFVGLVDRLVRIGW